MMTRLFVSQSEYDAIKKGENTLIVVEAKSKSPMYAIVRSYAAGSSSDKYSNYENAVFNGEVD